MSVDIVGQGIYTFSETARLTRASVGRVRAWFVGERSALGPVVRSDYAEGGPGKNLVSFLDLIDALVIGRLRKAGVSLQHLRKIHGALGEELRTNHPFSKKNFLTDGKKVFVHVASQLGDEKLKEVFTNRLAFPQILLPYLKQIDYHAEGLLASRWNICKGVVLDPTRRFGKPILSANGIATSVLAAAYRANGSDADLVADWYGLSVDDVRIATQFEGSFDRKVA